MTAKPAPKRGWEAFARPAQVNQRRYEAVRAYVLEGAPLAQAAARFGYTPSALASLVRDFRAGKLELFADPGRPGRKSAPKKDAARGRIIALRREGLSVHEISRRLTAEGTPLNRTGVGQILAEEGFGRLLRHPEPEASISPATTGRDTTLPRAKVIDFVAPAHCSPGPPKNCPCAFTAGSSSKLRGGAGFVPHRREDPLSQPPYVVFMRAPVDGVPHQGVVRRSVHP